MDSSVSGRPLPSVLPPPISRAGRSAPLFARCSAREVYNCNPHNANLLASYGVPAVHVDDHRRSRHRHRSHRRRSHRRRSHHRRRHRSHHRRRSHRHRHRRSRPHFVVTLWTRAPQSLQKIRRGWKCNAHTASRQATLKCALLISRWRYVALARLLALLQVPTSELKKTTAIAGQSPASLCGTI